MYFSRYFGKSVANELSSASPFGLSSAYNPVLTMETEALTLNVPMSQNCASARFGKCRRDVDASSDDDDGLDIV